MMPMPESSNRDKTSPAPPPYQFSDCSSSNDSPQTRADGPYHETHSSGQQQTIPKSTIEMQQPQHTDPRRCDQEFRRKVDDFNRQHTCTPVQPGNSVHKRERLLESLAAPRAFFGSITIEPVAFLAMLALYIEFPAIQDLIYTKVCLDIVAKHPNFTLTTATLTNGHSEAPANPTEARVLLDVNVVKHSSLQLPPSSRIQQLDEGHPDPSVVPLRPYHETRDHLICDRLNRSAIPAFIRQEILDVDSIFWLKYQIIICSLCALSSPYWGGISDRIGRLVTMNVPVVLGAICNSIALIFGLFISLQSHSLFHINWLNSSATLIGLSGGHSVLIMNLFGFISDNSTSEDRTKRVTILESVIYVSHSFGFLINRSIMQLGLAPPNRVWLNRHFVAFSVCILLNLACIMYSWFKLRHHKFHRFLNNFEREQQEAAIIGHSEAPASNQRAVVRSSATSDTNELASSGGLGSERLRELTSCSPDDLNADSSDKSIGFWRAIVTLRYYKETYLAAAKPRESRSVILLLLFCGFISAMSLVTLMSLTYIYVKMDPFNWTTSQYSYWNFMTSITRSAALIGLTLCMRFVPNWNVPDPLVAILGFIGKSVGLLMIGLAQSSTTIYWTLIVFVVSEYSLPPIRSLLSKLVIKEELGKIYSCLGALQNICFIIGNVGFYVAYTAFERRLFFKLTFLVVAGIEFSAVLIMIVVYVTLRRRVIAV